MHSAIEGPGPHGLLTEQSELDAADEAASSAARRVRGGLDLRWPDIRSRPAWSARFLRTRAGLQLRQRPMWGARSVKSSCAPRSLAHRLSQTVQKPWQSVTLAPTLSQLGAHKERRPGTPRHDCYWSAEFEGHCAATKISLRPTGGGQVAAGSNPVSPSK